MPAPVWAAVVPAFDERPSEIPPSPSASTDVVIQRQRHKGGTHNILD